MFEHWQDMIALVQDAETAEAGDAQDHHSVVPDNVTQLERTSAAVPAPAAAAIGADPFAANG